MVLAASTISGCASTPVPRIAAIGNPVIDANFRDPAALKAPDGYYYVYATQVESKVQNIQFARSRDLMMRERLGDAPT